MIKLRNPSDKLILTEENRFVTGQVALWYSWDIRFKGDIHKGLMIRGNVGTGKTLIVQALCEIIWAYEILVPCFLHATELSDLYARGDVDGIDRAKKRSYTIIDDVGVEAVETKSYGNIKEPFNDVFDYRYRNNKRTIITTNLTPSEIEQKYGTRIIDRFRECMNDLVLDGESFRK
ncbi:hypothetical protein [Proteiniphilum sp. X52]|uniref:hypothetical protein n=1 Tax=Proteiniphilum sp. X52 TaxID=2382159 RepID=UPI0011CD8B5F|nr:hypothetical protein [Proteiniphilum sp. X52]